MDENQVYRLWNEFKDMKFTKNEETKTDFHEWKAGTSKQEIMNWFDENYSGGLAALLD